MSVENFFQDSIFDDIFPAVPATANFQQKIPQQPLEPLRPSEPLGETQQVKRVGRVSSSGEPGLDQPLPEFRVVRSTRRKRGVTAFRSNGVIEIHIPDRTTRRAERELIPEMIALVLAREAKSRRGDGDLHQAALRLLATYLPEFHERPSAITWRSMQGRWGSCTTVDGTIRIAQRLASAPGYVLDCVIFHELIHLRIPGHGADFAELISRYPDLERAEAFLEGFEVGLAAPPERIYPQDLPL